MADQGVKTTPDAQAGQKPLIELSFEMIEAGRQRLLQDKAVVALALPQARQEGLVIGIYAAMARAARAGERG